MKKSIRLQNFCFAMFFKASRVHFGYQYFIEIVIFVMKSGVDLFDNSRF